MCVCEVATAIMTHIGRIRSVIKTMRLIAFPTVENYDSSLSGVVRYSEGWCEVFYIIQTDGDITLYQYPSISSPFVVACNVRGQGGRRFSEQHYLVERG